MHTGSPMNQPQEPPRRLPYRGTVAWLLQRISAIVMVVLLPLKLYTGWAARDKLPWVLPGSPKQLHFNAALDIVLLLCLLIHMAYGIRVMLIDAGVIREDRWFWRFTGGALGLFFVVVYFVYLRGE